MTKQNEKWAQYAAQITAAIAEMFEEGSDNHIDQQELMEDDNLTQFFHALANAAPTMLYCKITGDDKTNLEFNYIANTLCFQFGRYLEADSSDENF